MTTDIDVAEVLQLERELQTAECRRDRARVSALLAEDFLEAGVSGRVWDRPSMLELLGAESGDEAVIEIQDLTGFAFPRAEQTIEYLLAHLSAQSGAPQYCIGLCPHPPLNRDLQG